MFSRLRHILGIQGRGIAPPAIDTEAITPEEVYLDAADRFLDVQVSTMDVLDNKTANAFSVGSVVLPVMFGLLGLSTRRAPITTGVILGLALIAYVVLVVFVWRASKIRVLEYRPVVPTLGEYSKRVSGQILQRWVADQYAISTELNKTTLVRKGVWVGRAITALYAEGFLLSLAAISTLF